MKAGTCREKRPGVYEFRLRLGPDPVTDEPRRLSHTWRGSKREVGKALAAWVAEQTHEHKTEPTTETVGWLVDAWLALQEQAGLSPTTIQTYRGYVENWIKPTLGSIHLAELTVGDVRELHAKMAAAGRADSTVRQAHNILRGALAFAVEKEWINRNVAAIRRPPRQSAPNVTLATSDEIDRLIRAAGDPGSDLSTCIALAVVLGARAGELCGLRWSDIDHSGGTVSITRSVYNVKGVTGEKAPKSARPRTIDMDDLTAAVVRTRVAWQLGRNERVGTTFADDPYLLSFLSDGSGPPRPDSYSSAFGRLRNELGMRHLHLHSLRHFMASYLIDRGVPIPVVAERLGHSSPAVTARIYAHAVTGRGKEAAEIMGMLLMPATTD